VLALAGCVPLDGSPCDRPDEVRCDSPTAAAYCEMTSSGGRKWRAYACPAGCAGDKCGSWKGADVGTPCPPFDPRGWCDADGHLIGCSVRYATDGGPSVGVRVGYDCAACRKDVPIEQTADCSSGLCKCG